MTIAWLLYVLLVGALLCAGAGALSSAAIALGRPSRGVWAAALAGIVVLGAIAPEQKLLQCALRVERIDRGAVVSSRDNADACGRRRARRVGHARSGIDVSHRVARPARAAGGRRADARVVGDRECAAPRAVRARERASRQAASPLAAASAARGDGSCRAGDGTRRPRARSPGDRRPAITARAERRRATSHPRARARARARARSPAAGRGVARRHRAAMASSRLVHPRAVASRHRARLRRARASRRRLTEEVRHAAHRSGRTWRRKPHRRARAGGRAITIGAEDQGNERIEEAKQSCVRGCRVRNWRSARAGGVRGEDPDGGRDRADGRGECAAERGRRRIPAHTVRRSER